MATNAKWTIVFDDKSIIKNHAEGAEEGIGYKIIDDAFWNQSKFSNIWAIQYGTSVASDAVEYRDDTPHAEYDSAVLGDISQFVTRWDSAHLLRLQSDWDDNVITTRDSEGNILTSESLDDQIARKGARPTSYSSS
jgi:hypothetical protein